jgi:Papain-like cysteine protease AvrRpt2
MNVPRFMLPSPSITKVRGVHARAQAASLGGGGGSSKLAQFSVPRQVETNWCWSAVGVGVAAFYKSRKWSQCQLAGAVLNQSCCVQPTPGACNVYGSLDASLQTVGHFSSRSNNCEPFALVQSEINNRRPMGARIAWAGNGAHFVALYGWLITGDGKEFVDVADPWYGTRNLPYSKFVSRYRNPGDRWTHSYFTSVGGVALGGGVPDVSAPTNR